jgi:hypothetical protein
VLLVEWFIIFSFENHHTINPILCSIADEFRKKLCTILCAKSCKEVSICLQNVLLSMYKTIKNSLNANKICAKADEWWEFESLRVWVTKRTGFQDFIFRSKKNTYREPLCLMVYFFHSGFFSGVSPCFLLKNFNWLFKFILLPSWEKKIRMKKKYLVDCVLFIFDDLNGVVVSNADC